MPNCAAQTSAVRATSMGVVTIPVNAPAAAPISASSFFVRWRSGSIVLPCHRFSASNVVT